MPYIQENPDETGYLVYNAPVDEKTKKIREMFDVDEETGYPRKYNWRSMSQLGNSYTFDEPFLKLSKSHPDDFVSSKITYFGMSVFGAFIAHFWMSRWNRRPYWSRLYNIPIMVGLSCTVGYYAQKKTMERQALRNAVTIDYVQSHPERFGKVERYKLREVLFHHLPKH